MSGSHMSAAARHHHEGDWRLQLVPTAERGLPAHLAGAIDGHLATFAEHVRDSGGRGINGGLGQDCERRPITVIVMVHLPVFVGRMLVGGPGSV
jgi:hypothetical protein